MTDIQDFTTLVVRRDSGVGGYQSVRFIAREDCREGKRKGQSIGEITTFAEALVLRFLAELRGHSSTTPITHIRIGKSEHIRLQKEITTSLKQPLLSFITTKLDRTEKLEQSFISSLGILPEGIASRCIASHSIL
ncbi:MAG: hypothetical protein AAF329_28630, partial [Cyanobacteria bacterium P01_A01_bin.17]